MKLPEPIGIECPKCGCKSLEVGGAGVTTLMYCPSFTDIDGRLHHHDSNITTTPYICLSCGHTFTGSTHKTCWCGWTNKK